MKYTCDGALTLHDPTYIKRECDDQLYEALTRGNLCYVRGLRKTGKSSLRVQTVARLKQDDISCVEIALSGNVTQSTLEKWYNSILWNLNRKLLLDIDLKLWLNNLDWLSPQDRLTEFIETVVLKNVAQPIVIFIDEIESVVHQNFPVDDFFAYLRACHNESRSNPYSDYRRLTFCLLGTLTPNELIQNKSRTPFNVGEYIELKNFTKEQVLPLAEGLGNRFNDPVQVLTQILSLTDGQPFLTQKVCKFVLEQVDSEAPDITEIVKKSGFEILSF
jgi:hypothetical protein